MRIAFSLYLSSLAVLSSSASASLSHQAVARAPSTRPRCRSQPGDASFPSNADWNVLNSQVGGRLLKVVPSAEFCLGLPAGECTFEQWTSARFMMANPGTMLQTNWEQDYLSNPPSLCTQNGTECGQGNVPVYAINVTSAADIQAGIRFASKHNLKLSVKSSGHDFLGRSTARGSLLIWTHYLKSTSFTEHFRIGGKDRGSAVTAGSGVAVNELYVATKSAGKMVVTGVTASVAAAGGYIQGGGHSAFSPLLGLAADNALEFSIVTADGNLLTANEVSNPDLFWALRGGGAGSWGVIVSATFRTFPTFNATEHTAIFYFPSSAIAAAFAQLHARHIFDWDAQRAGQYSYLVSLNDPATPGYAVALYTFFPNATGEQATAAMAPLMDEAQAQGFYLVNVTLNTGLANDVAYQADTGAGTNTVLGSRLIPEKVYRDNVEEVGKTYAALLDDGAPNILGHLVSGGKVSENANINSAVNPKWRNTKIHLIVAGGWADNATISDVEAIKDKLTNSWVPRLAALTGEHDSGAYSNEADVREPNFQTTFFGRNYDRLRRVKQRYDPEGMFIVGAGVGSEDWDTYGTCRK